MLSALATEKLHAGPPWSWAEKRLETDLDRDTIDHMIEMFALSTAQTHALEQRYLQLPERFVPLQNCHSELLDQHTKDSEAASSPAEANVADIDYAEAARALADAEVAVDRQFLEEFRATLCEEQVQRWGDFERWRRRHQWLRHAPLYIESSVDQLSLIEQLRHDGDFTFNATLESLMDRYELEMDVVLQRMGEAKVERNRTSIQRRLRMSSSDRMKLSERHDAYILKQHRRLRDLNRHYRLLIRAALPAAYQQKYNTLYRESALSSRIHLKGLQSRYLLTRVNEMTLSSEQQVAVDAALGWKDHKCALIFPKLVKVQAALAESCFHGGRDPNERARLRKQYHAVFRQRYELEQKLIDMIWAMLTPQQRDQFSSRPSVHYRPHPTAEAR